MFFRLQRKMAKMKFFIPKLFLFAYGVRESWLDKIHFFQNSDPVRRKICLGKA